jgi:hypothetical protein
MAQHQRSDSRKPVLVPHADTSPSQTIAQPPQAQHWAGKVMLICAPPGSEIDCAKAWFSAMGGTTVTVGERLLPLEWIDQYAESFDLALVDCDHLGDDGDVIDFSLRMRRFSPNLPLVMVSSRVHAHDFGTERLAICDVTLQKPFTQSAFAIGLQTAIVNHRIYQSKH